MKKNKKAEVYDFMKPPVKTPRAWSAGVDVKLVPVKTNQVDREIFKTKAKLFHDGNVSELIRRAVRVYDPRLSVRK